MKTSRQQEEFFKTFNIKQRWWDSHYDFEKLYLGHYNTYLDLYRSLKDNNGWDREETKDVIRKECYKAYPRITDGILLDLVILVSNNQNLMTLSKIQNREDLVNFILKQCIKYKELYQKDITKMFPMPGLKEETDCLAEDDGGQWVL